MADLQSILVFVPAYNEAGKIEGAIQDFISAAQGVFDDCEVLIVNDGSADKRVKGLKGLPRKIRVPWFAPYLSGTLGLFALMEKQSTWWRFRFRGIRPARYSLAVGDASREADRMVEKETQA